VIAKNPAANAFNLTFDHAIYTLLDLFGDLLVLYLLAVQFGLLLGFSQLAL